MKKSMILLCFMLSGCVSSGTYLNPARYNALMNNNTVYSPSECTGPVIMGVCHGGVIPNGSYHPTCHGEMLNGMCTGPMF